VLYIYYFRIFDSERPSPRSYLAAVIILSVSLNARKFGEFKLSRTGNAYETTSLMEYPAYTLVTSVWQELLTTGLLPFAALARCNVLIYSKIRESSKHETHRCAHKSMSLLLNIVRTYTLLYGLNSFFTWEFCNIFTLSERYCCIKLILKFKVRNIFNSQVSAAVD